MTEKNSKDPVEIFKEGLIKIYSDVIENTIKKEESKKCRNNLEKVKMKEKRTGIVIEDVEDKKIDRKKQYQIRKSVAYDISNLVKDGEYETALTLLENTSDDLMEKDSLYTGLAINLTQKAYEMVNKEQSSPNATKMVEQVIKYCKSKSKFLTGVALAASLSLYGCGQSDLEKTIERTDKANGIEIVENSPNKDIYKDLENKPDAGNEKYEIEKKLIDDAYKTLEKVEKFGNYSQDKVNEIQTSSNDRLNLLETFVKEDNKLYNDADSRPKGYDNIFEDLEE